MVAGEKLLLQFQVKISIPKLSADTRMTTSSRRESDVRPWNQLTVNGLSIWWSCLLSKPTCPVDQHHHHKPWPGVNTGHRTKQAGGLQLSRARKVSQLWCRSQEKEPQLSDKIHKKEKEFSNCSSVSGHPVFAHTNESHESQQTKYRHRLKSYKRCHTGMERVKLVTALAA